MKPTDQERAAALEYFDSFCRFIDGIDLMGKGFVENDFMSKPMQARIRALLTEPRAEVVTVEELLLKLYGREYCDEDYCPSATDSRIDFEWIAHNYPNGVIVKDKP